MLECHSEEGARHVLQIQSFPSRQWLQWVVLNTQPQLEPLSSLLPGKALHQVACALALPAVQKQKHFVLHSARGKADFDVRYGRPVAVGRLPRSTLRNQQQLRQRSRRRWAVRRRRVQA